ncbi:MAG: hypothetical protein HKO65_13015 [Gemmatimonadetes bacterium]|nr:hypothetical protein [Gemmatimonadota bacterium]
MGDVTKGRRAAAAVLRAVARGRRLDLALSEAVAHLSDQDRRWVHESSYGATRFRGRLDHLLDIHLRNGLSSLSPLVLDYLRLGAYQLLFMDGVPSYAAISQTVDQVKEVAGAGGGRMANGVLRSLEREGGEASRFPGYSEDPEAHLSTWGSHPKWMIRRWLKRLGPEAVRRLVDTNNTPAPVYFRPLGVTLDEARDLLRDEGFFGEVVGKGIPCLRLKDGTNPARLLERVPGFIQDPGAALVTEYADVWGEDLVADLCAAPGGKTLALAHSGAYVLAADRSMPRLALLRENLERVGGRVDLVAALAEKPPFRELPVLLLDVPCSGTGTLRRHPDARWRLTPDSLRRLAELQGKMLEAGAQIVRPGGVLVYSTCTLEPEENQEQVEGFLSRNPRFAMAGTKSVPEQYVDSQGRLLVTPHDTGFDGAFAARMVRTS